MHATKGIQMAILLLYTYFLFYIMYSFTLSRHKHKVLSNNWWCNMYTLGILFILPLYTIPINICYGFCLWAPGSLIKIFQKKLSISWSAWAHIPILNLRKMLKFAKKKSMPYCTMYIFERVPNWHTGMLTQFD